MSDISILRKHIEKLERNLELKQEEAKKYLEKNGAEDYYYFDLLVEQAEIEHAIGYHKEIYQKEELRVGSISEKAANKKGS